MADIDDNTHRVQGPELLCVYRSATYIRGMCLIRFHVRQNPRTFKQKTTEPCSYDRAATAATAAARIEIALLVLACMLLLQLCIT